MLLKPSLVKATGRFAAVIGLMSLLNACTTVPLPSPVEGYTCCNLRVYDGWISSNNVQGGSVVPAGERIRVTAIKRDYYAYGEIGGSEFGLRDDQAKKASDTMKWLRTIAVAEDPRPQIATWPSDVRAAVGAGKVLRGMTRQQVTVAIGLPARSDTPDLTASTWRYWVAMNDQTVDLNFNADGKLESLSGASSSVRTVLLEP